MVLLSVAKLVAVGKFDEAKDLSNISIIRNLITGIWDWDTDKNIVTSEEHE